MNPLQFIVALMYQLRGFIFHDDLISELTDILKKSGAEKKFLSLLTSRLQFLLEKKNQAIIHEEFELLRDGVFSMHLSTNAFNVRILYMFLPDNTPVLLHAFYERAGHNKTNYTGRIELAKQRFIELEED